MATSPMISFTRSKEGTKPHFLYQSHLTPTHALKGQKHLAQGNTLGISAIRHIVMALFYGQTVRHTLYLQRLLSSYLISFASYMLLYMKKFRSLRNFSRIHCSKNVVHSSLCTHVAKIRFSFVTSKKLTRKNSLIL